MLRRDNQIFYRGVLLGISLFVSFSTMNAQRKGRKVSVPIAKQSLSVEQLSEMKALLSSYRTAEAETYLSSLEKKQFSSEAVDTLMLYREQLERQKRMLAHVEPVKLLVADTCSWDNVVERIAFYSPKLADRLHLNHRFGGYKISVMGYNAEITAAGGELLHREHWGDEVLDYSLEGAGINKPMSQENYPFLFSDGIRLIFASDRVGGLGGYDLYQSFYNIEQKAYREPMHLSMPFNSPHNDYLFAYDEEKDYSFLLSDRGTEGSSLVLYVMSGLPQSMKSLSSVEKLDEEPSEYAQEEATSIAKLEITQLGLKEEGHMPDTMTHCFLPLDGSRVIRVWEDFVSSDARESYKLYLKRLEGYRRLLGEQKLLREQRGDKTRLLELEKQLPQEYKMLEQELIALKNKEIQARK